MNGFEEPIRRRWQIEPLEHKVGVVSEYSPMLRAPARSWLNDGRPTVCHRNGVSDVKFPLAAEVEQAKRCIRALLDFCKHEPRTDRMNRARRNQHHFISHYIAPGDLFFDATVID
jgi:hypothetical protein